MRSWIKEENLRAWLEIVAGALAYDFDDDDWDAVRFGIASTDVEKDTWYDYPLGDATVRVALDPGSVVVAISLDDAEQIAPQTALATSIAQQYLLSRDRRRK
jgi:hypothetical protein